MSNLSDIGFPAKTGKEYGQLIELAVTEGELIPCEKGSYLKYTDPSGAQLYCQINKKKEVLGMNPHYSGQSKFPVAITKKVDRSESALDGSFHCWAAPTDAKDPESGAYPFVVDLPDFYTLAPISFPINTHLQLSAFAQSEFNLFTSEAEFNESQKEGMKFASQSFIATGLFSSNAEDEGQSAPEAYALFNGIVKEWAKKTNKISGQPFYWILTETLGGEIDVLVDPKLISKEPQKGWILSGQFWLSARVLL